jgi:peptidoglycan/xylan/chitin deacetylase (PgdA/CDA1 family)
LTVSTELFGRQMEYLSKKGYRSISLGDLVDFHLTPARRMPPRPVVITFDDGFQDNYLFAFPILRRLQFRATFFLTVDLIGTDRILEDEWIEKPDLSTDRMLSWQEVREMVEEGMDFGSHTCSHANLLAVSKRRAEEEIVESHRKLEQKIGCPPFSFCYPYGAFDEAVTAMVKAVGFKCAVVTPNRHIDKEECFSLFRAGVYGDNGLNTFKFKISKRFRCLQGQKWYWDLRTRRGRSRPSGESSGSGSR